MNDESKSVNYRQALKPVLKRDNSAKTKTNMSGSKLPNDILRVTQHIPLPWSKLPASKHLLARNEWLTGVKGRLPRHYVEFYKQWQKGPQAFIHDLPPQNSKFEKNEHGQVWRVQKARIPILYPDEFHKGLWGGEGVVKGGLEPPETKHENYHYPTETYWFPKLHLGVVYSEILDKYMEVTMTERAQRLIDEAFGLDNYLLKTDVNEIYSWLGLGLKRSMLLTLANAVEELYPNDQSKRSELLDKYKDHIVDQDVAEWHGLSLQHAIRKQERIDHIEDDTNTRPKKEEYREELVQMLKAGYMEDLDPSLLYDDLSEKKEPGAMKIAWKSIKDQFK